MIPATSSFVGIKLQEVFESCSPGTDSLLLRIYGAEEILFSSCCSKAEHCKPGDLFVLLDDSLEDNFSQVSLAITNGATAVLAEQFLPVEVPFALVHDAGKCYGILCQALADHPSQAMGVIGVTGTNGKTSVCHLIDAILAKGEFSSCRLPEELSEAAAPQLARQLSEVRSLGVTHPVLELSSLSLAEHRASGIALDAAVITSARSDHLDYHGSVLNYRKIKRRILDHLKPEGFAVLNADDPATALFLEQLNHPVLTIGIKQHAEVTARLIKRQQGAQTFIISAGSEHVPVTTKIIGDHHIYNCLSAAAVGLVYGIPLTTIAAGLESVITIPGCLEPLLLGQEPTVVIDRGDSPDALAAALKALKGVQPNTGKLYCILGITGKQTPENRALLGRIMERYSDLGIITGFAGFDSSDPAQVDLIHDILDGYDHPAKAHVYPNRIEAIRWILSKAKAGDTILIAGQGNLQIPSFSEEETFFSDAEIACQWIKQMQTDQAEKTTLHVI